MFDRYAADLPISVRIPEPRGTDQKLAVLLTGATGSLGSYILDSLLANPRIARVYCLNRGPDSYQRQQDSMAAKGLAPLDDERIEILEANLSEPYFGLPLSKYRTLLSEVTTVIHNAWRVDFNLSLESFDKNVASVRRFIDFSARSRFGASVFFVSSVGTVGNWVGDDATPSEAVASSSTIQCAYAPERILNDWSAPQAMGYAQSKFVSEQLLEAAACEADIPTVVCRVGQIGGPTTEAGVWPKQEWLPSLVASSKHLGKIPATLGQLDAVDWIPVDVLGRGIVELALHSEDAEQPGAQVYHMVNPQHTPWSAIVDTIAQVLDREGGVDRKIQQVPLQEWVDALRASIPSTHSEDVGRNPAVHLVDFYQELVTATRAISLDTAVSATVSPSLAGLSPITPELVETWMRQWSF
jgi:thioester reductase-like protein